MVESWNLSKPEDLEQRYRQLVEAPIEDDQRRVELGRAYRDLKASSPNLYAGKATRLLANLGELDTQLAAIQKLRTRHKIPLPCCFLRCPLGKSLNVLEVAEAISRSRLNRRQGENASSFSEGSQVLLEECAKFSGSGSFDYLTPESASGVVNLQISDPRDATRKYGPADIQDAMDVLLVWSQVAPDFTEENFRELAEKQISIILSAPDRLHPERLAIVRNLAHVLETPLRESNVTVEELTFQLVAYPGEPKSVDVFGPHLVHTSMPYLRFSRVSGEGGTQWIRVQEQSGTLESDWRLLRDQILKKYVTLFKTVAKWMDADSQGSGGDGDDNSGPVLLVQCHLVEAFQELRTDYPNLKIIPVGISTGDFRFRDWNIPPELERPQSLPDDVWSDYESAKNAQILSKNTGPLADSTLPETDNIKEEGAHGLEEQPAAATSATETQRTPEKQETPLATPEGRLPKET